jgi:hypothetical protein
LPPTHRYRGLQAGHEKERESSLETELILLASVELGVAHLASGSSDEDLVSLVVAAGGMVLSVGDSPRVVGEHPDGMKDEPDGIVVGLVVRESAMTAFVTEDPL